MGKPTLFIDTGHGAQDRGNVTTAFVEAEELRQFTTSMEAWARSTGKVVNRAGGIVFVNRGLALADSIRHIQDDWKADGGDLCVDVHLDYNAGTSGALVIVDQTANMRVLAEKLLAMWCAATGLKNRGVHDSKVAARNWRKWNDYGFTAAPFPGWIFEAGCLNSPGDMAVCRQRYYQALAMELLWEVWSER